MSGLWSKDPYRFPPSPPSFFLEDGLKGGEEEREWNRRKKVVVEIARKRWTGRAWRSAGMPAAEHSLIAFPDPWVSYLCHRCLRHYITLLYGGLKSRKRGPRFSPLPRFAIKVSIGPASRQRLLSCAKLLMYSRSSYRAILRFLLDVFLFFFYEYQVWIAALRCSCHQRKYSLFRFDLSPVPNVCSQDKPWRKRKGVI